MAKTNKDIITVFSDKETACHDVKGKAATLKSNFLLLSFCHFNQTGLLWKLITLQLLLKNTCDPWLIFSIQIHSFLKTQFILLLPFLHHFNSNNSSLSLLTLVIGLKTFLYIVVFILYRFYFYNWLTFSVCLISTWFSVRSPACVYLL